MFRMTKQLFRYGSNSVSFLIRQIHEMQKHNSDHGSAFHDTEKYHTIHINVLCQSHLE